MQILKKITNHFIILSSLMCSSSFLSAQTAAIREYQVKAVFLFNFTQFVEWPSTSFSSPQAPFVIGILGNDPFNSYLTEAIYGERVNGHPLVTQHYNTVENVETCHILFISQSEINNMENILSRLKDRSILTVSDANTFSQYGGMIKFVTKNSKIQLKINPDAATAAKLVISSKLLRSAEIFVPDKK